MRPEVWVKVIILQGLFLKTTVSKLPILMYHDVTPDRSEGLTISAQKLEEQLAFLAENGFRTYHLAELMDYNKLPHDKNVVITFDDAYCSQLELAYPLLQKYNLKATFFVPLAYLGKTDEWNTSSIPIMTAAQLKSMSPQTIELGFHSYHHKMYSTMRIAEIEEDTALCFQTVSENDLPISATLAYPYGKYPKGSPEKEEFVQVLENHGFRYGLRIGNRVNKFPFKNPFEIQRIDVKGEFSLKQFRRKLKYGKRMF